MALKQIGPNQQKVSRAFKDIAIALGKNPFTDDTNVVKNDNAVKQAIKNLILTVPGEKPFNPLIGSKVQNLLFEPLDPFTADTLRDEIINTINQHESRIRLLNCMVSPIHNRNMLNVTIEYKIVGQPITESFSFVLQRPE